MKYNMKLNNDPFERIKNGTKKYELRLNDEKRRILKVSDLIEFTNKDTNEVMLTQIDGIFKYSSFEELYKHFNKSDLGYFLDEEANYSDMDKYYSKDEQNKYGVLAIKIRKVYEK